MKLKNISLILCLLVSFSTFAQEQDTVLTNPVVQNQPIPRIDPNQPSGTRKSPLLAGLLSLVVPGSGQLYNGKTGSAIFYLVTNVSCNLIMKSAVKSGDQDLYNLAYASGLGINLFAVIDACTGANKVNFDRGYRSDVKVRVSPYVGRNPDLMASSNRSGNNYGLSLNLQF